MGMKNSIKKKWFMLFLFLIPLHIVTMLYSPGFCWAQQGVLSLSKFDWVVEKTRVEPSIKRMTVSSSLLTGFDYENFKPEGGKVSIITLRIKAKTSGRIRLTPELFIIEESSFYGLCQGLRVVKPKPLYGAGGFTPPSGGGSTTTLKVTDEDTLVLELAFVGELGEDDRLLVASPVLNLIKSKPISK